MAVKTSAKGNGILGNWLNLILHITAVIAERKARLGRPHLLKNVQDVFVIIVLEGVLAIVSIPVYFAGHGESYSRDNRFYVAHSIRRYITFLLIILISAVIILKLFLAGLIAFSSSASNSGEAVSPVIQSGMPAFGLLETRSSAAVIVPELDRTARQGLMISGKAAAGNRVVVFLTPEDSKSLRPGLMIFKAGVDENGYFGIANSLSLKPGSYSATALAVNQDLKLNSAESTSVSVFVEPSWPDLMNDILDGILHVLVYAFIGIGLIVLLIML